MVDTQVLGKGLQFPYRHDRGRLEMADGVESVEAALKMLFSTTEGQRFMLPQYGSKVPYLLFEPCDEQTTARAEVYIGEAVERWIPRIETLFVRGTPDPERRVIQLVIQYTLRNDPTPRTFVYPFYLRSE